MAIIGGAIIGTAALGGSIFSGIFGSSAAKKQAEAIGQAALVAERTALTLDSRARQDLAPFRDLGVESADIIGKILRGEVSLDDVLGKSSIFKWQQSEGERALNRQLSLRGLGGSGAGLETLARFNNELVANEGQRYWDRLFNVTTLGSNAAARTATNTTQTGQTLAGIQAQTGVAGAQAQGDVYRSIGTIGQGISQFGANIGGGIMYKPLLENMSEPKTYTRQAGGYDTSIFK